MLQITMIGRLTNEPEIKTNKAGKEFICFTVAVNKGYGDNQTTTYVSCCAGSSLLHALSKARKGSLLCITGELTVESYLRKDGSPATNVKCYISSFYYIPVKSSSNNDDQTQGQSTLQTNQPQQNNNHYRQPPTPPQRSDRAQSEEVTLDGGDLPF